MQKIFLLTYFCLHYLREKWLSVNAKSVQSTAVGYQDVYRVQQRSCFVHTCTAKNLDDLLYQFCCWSERRVQTSKFRYFYDSYVYLFCNQFVVLHYEQHNRIFNLYSKLFNLVEISIQMFKNIIRRPVDRYLYKS